MNLFFKFASHTDDFTKVKIKISQDMADKIGEAINMVQESGEPMYFYPSLSTEIAVWQNQSITLSTGGRLSEDLSEAQVALLGGLL